MTTFNRTAAKAKTRNPARSRREAPLRERRLDVERRITNIEGRLGEAWVHRAEGRAGQAWKLLQALRKEVASLPEPQADLLAEIDVLERRLVRPEVERPAAFPFDDLRPQGSSQGAASLLIALRRFQGLRSSFREKVAARIGGLHRLSQADPPVGQDVLEDLLDQVSVAQGILAFLAPALAGRADAEGVAGELTEFRGVLLEHLEVRREAP